MFMRKRLACSFCGRGAADVSKLVAGPRVFICDACVAEAARIMSDPGAGHPANPQSPGIWRRVRGWFGGRGTTRTGLVGRSAVAGNPL